MEGLMYNFVLLIVCHSLHVLSISPNKELLANIDELEELVSIFKNHNSKFKESLDFVSSQVGIVKGEQHEKLKETFDEHNIVQRNFADHGNNQMSDRQMKVQRSTARMHSVGFSASMTKHNENLNLQDTVKFQNLITNDGNGYDHITGIFRAPVRGLYFFSVVIMSHAAEDMETEIVKNGDGIVRTYSGDSTTWNTGTQSTVLLLDVGDQVWVRILSAFPAVNNGNVRVFGYGFSSFSGFLISE